MLNRMGLIPMAGLIAAAMLAAAGCDAVSLKGAETDGRAAGGNGWPFKPAAMRIHPFTAIQRDSEEEALVLEARIELRDQLGDPAKGVGRFRFELYAREPEASQQGERRRVEVWNAPLRTLDQNRRHYDPITNSYLFRLKLPERPPEDDRLELVVQFNPRRGQRLMAEETVGYEPREDEEAGQDTGDAGEEQPPVEAEGSEAG